MSKPAEEDYFAILELEPGASKAEVATAYRKKSLKVHPDRYKGDDPEGATPITTLLAPAAAASLKLMSGKPRSTAQPGNRYCPTQPSGRQSRRPIAVLASKGLLTSPRNSR